MADTRGTERPAGPTVDGGRSSREAPPSVCPVAFCPICAAVSTVNRASPEVLQHLLVAGQQFLLALKAVVDARAADFGDGQEPPGVTSMERIDIG